MYIYIYVCICINVRARNKWQYILHIVHLIHIIIKQPLTTYYKSLNQNRKLELVFLKQFSSSLTLVDHKHESFHKSKNLH